MNYNSLEAQIEYFFKKVKKPKSLEYLYEYLGISSNEEKDYVNQIINQKLSKYEIVETTSGKYISINKTTFRKGRFSSNHQGGVICVDHFYINKDGEEIYYETVHKVKKEDINGAIDGDVVLVDIISNNEKEKHDSKIIKVIERKLETVVGEVYKDANTYYLRPEDAKKKTLTISLGNNDSYVVGEKIAVTLDQAYENNFYTASLKKRLGHKDDPDMDIILEAYKNGIEVDFSEDALHQTEEIPTVVSEVDKIGRMDLTKKEIFTIDGCDTKDIDDAISLEVLENGNYLLGVHIADPAYYIEEDSYLDCEANSRGTSAYLANRVIPMLPHKLSNGICSLNPNVERLAQTCFMEINSKGEIVNYNLGRSVICSNIQMNYDDVNQILKEDAVISSYESHISTLKSMEKLARILNIRRKKQGALEIERPELKVILDEDGKPIEFNQRYQDVGEKIIEEFMLVANETICKHLVSNFLPSVNRVHEDPDTEKIGDFLKLLKITGNPYSVNQLDLADCKVVQGISEFVSKIENNSMLQLQFLKSLKRARYSSTELGHSGLAKEFYCHFTSPMRRYPDFVQNRILSDFVYNQPTEEERKRLIHKWRHKLPEITQNSSRKERAADNCEKDVLMMKCAEYMQSFKGQEFTGTITDMDSNCIYVQLDNMIEGKVRPRNFEGRYYYNEDTKSMISLENKDDYYLGDRLLLQLKDSNKEKKLIDFKIIEKLNENKNIMKKENQKVKTKRQQMYYNSNKGKR